MPAKKRTSQTKHTLSTSPTASTSHSSADQQHRLRHTGPSISTRSSVSTVSARREHTPESPSTQEGAREQSLAKVSPPGARTPFTKFLYVLLVIILLLLGWYIHGMVTLLEKLKEEVGWWGIIVGDSARMPRWDGDAPCEGCGFGSDRPERQGGRTETGRSEGLEGSLNALADALGISPVQVASAVKPLIPQASLTRASKEETGGSEAVRILFEDATRNEGADTT